MEEFATKQLHLSRCISRLLENMMKIGKANITAGVIQSRLEMLDNMWNNFEQGHNEILRALSEVDKSHEYFTKDVFSITENSYLDTKSQLLDMMTKTPLPSSASTTKSPEMSDSRRNLPTIQLPTFTGEYQDWPNFRDLFTSIVINNAGLSPVERLHYLKTSLSGPPYLLLENITITNDNFDRAWNLICDRYENKRLILDAHMASLTNLNSCTRESAGELTRLLNGTVRAAEALKSMGEPVWNLGLVFLTVQKLDVHTKMAWESSLTNDKEPPTFDQLCTFLQKRVRVLEATEKPAYLTSTSSRGSSTSKPTACSRKTHVVSQPTTSRKCCLCSQGHFVLFCKHYKAKNPSERRHLIQQKNLCYNCLGSHAVKYCSSVKRCQQCAEKHHTSLHPFDHNELQAGSTSNFAGKTSMCCSASPLVTSVTRLATALVKVSSPKGLPIMTRALVDPCSEITLISERLAQQLRLPRKAVAPPVDGVAGVSVPTKGKVQLRLTSRLDDTLNYDVKAFVLTNLTSYCPPKEAISIGWEHLQDIELADPTVGSERSIDLILGADLYSQILLEGVRRGSLYTPVAQRTTLGWIVTGPVMSAQSASRRSSTMHCSQGINLETTLRKFWELEEIPDVAASLTPEEEECEKHFTTTVRREKSGRYIVRLPFRQAPTSLGHSKVAALRALENVERRMSTSKSLRHHYLNFMKKYEDLGHMQLISLSDRMSCHTSYYLPHHGVWKDSSTTTKLRVVFNGSSVSSTSISLNDLLHTGPQLLPDINLLLLRWRLHAIVFSADIEKMYRQIWLDKNDAEFQRIFWRESADQQVQTYKLLTVTYGLSCAPFLAIRTLRQLARDEQERFPLGANILREDTYVDDVVSGTENLFEAKEAQRQLILLLKAGGFNLRKWTSNVPALLSDLPRKWKTFVANRVSEIQALQPTCHWHHIDTGNNPADCSSRGLFPSQLITHSLWLTGPSFLRTRSDTWKLSSQPAFVTELESRTTTTLFATMQPKIGWDLLQKYSSFSRLLRILALIIRFVNKLRRVSDLPSCFFITASELRKARILCLRLVQRETYEQEYTALLQGRTIKGSLSRLSPILDPDGLLRVDGRLKHSLLPYDAKHPVILPCKHYVTEILVVEVHRLTLHGGPQLTLATLRQTYWIPGGRHLVRRIIHRCLTYLRWKADAPTQRMGDLPANRVTPSRAFIHVGVDYAGPFLVKTSGGTGYKSKKAYIAVFVCLAVRAIHLELVSDYTTEAFMAAFRRFTARRGKCASISSDQGTTFQGADRELRQLFAQSSSAMKSIATQLADEGITWKFIPPAAPHFGGIWGAGVKSVKHHLRRVVGDTRLTFEEMTTVLAQIEACLNSRPLVAITDSLDSLEVITPGHFLIGAPLTALPDHSPLENVKNLHSRWHLLQQMQLHFWSVWSREYLQTLQVRNKWRVRTEGLKVGDLCLIMNETTSPTKWPLARIIQTHPGADGLVRVVTVKTATTTLKRPISKLCLIPIN